MMSTNVTHINPMLFNLKEKYQNQIEQLQQKITEQQQEILKLQEQIKLLSYDKYYDC